MKLNKVTVITGLPGSGKTTLSKTIPGKMVNLDKHMLSKTDRAGFRNYTFTPDTNGEIVIEGLMTGEGFYPIMDKIISLAKATKAWKNTKHRFIVHVIQFDEDRESCLWNDRVRGREKDAAITIKNMNILVPKDELIERYPRLKFNFSKKKVVRASPVDAWVSDSMGKNQLRSIAKSKPGTFRYKENGLWLTSDTWSLGGSWGSYDGSSGSVSSEPTPTSFKEFDELLEKITPSITFMQYKKLYRETVEVVQTSEGDYYGGIVNYAQYVCNLNKLYSGLTELNLIDPIKE